MTDVGEQAQRRTSDTIALTGITAVGYHGVFDHERRNGQPFVVDVVLYTDIRPAAHTDDLAETTDYGAVAEQVKDIITGKAFNLIETLGEQIAAQVLDTFGVEAVDVRVHKPKAPLQVPFGDVILSIHRSRP